MEQYRTGPATETEIFSRITASGIPRGSLRLIGQRPAPSGGVDQKIVTDRPQA